MFEKLTTTHDISDDKRRQATTKRPPGDPPPAVTIEPQLMATVASVAMAGRLIGFEFLRRIE